MQDFSAGRISLSEIDYLRDMKWLRNILKGCSLTGALFVFQACYGTPDAPFLDEHGNAPMTFSVVSSVTGEPLEGIRVRGSAWDRNPQEDLGVTGPDGRCRVNIPYFRNIEGPYLVFEDAEGKYASKDTVLADLREREIVVKLNALL